MSSSDGINSTSAAVCATVALGLLVATGFSSNFVRVEYLSFENSDGRQVSSLSSSSFGVYFAESDMEWMSSDDPMWMLCRVFLSFALALGSIATVLAWAIAFFVTPTRAGWLILSVTTSVTAVFCVPVFLLFEAEPCIAESQHEPICDFSLGAYLLTFSLLLWVSVTIITQCLDPPFGLKSSLSEWQVWPKSKLRRWNARASAPDANDETLMCIRKLLPKLERKSDDNTDEEFPNIYVEVDRTMLEDEEDEEQQRFVEEHQAQEVMLGESSSQTLIMGDTESQTVVVRDVESDASSGMLTSINENWLNSVPNKVSDLKPLNDERLVYTQAFVGRVQPQATSNEPTNAATLSFVVPVVGPHNTLESVQEEEELSAEEVEKSNNVQPLDPAPPSSNRATVNQTRESILVLGAIELPALVDVDNADEDGSNEEEKKINSSFVDIDVDDNDRIPENDLKDFLNNSDDLGSLEPTILHETGAESLLDGTDECSKSKKATSPMKISDAMHKVLYAPVKLVSRASEIRRFPTHLKEYKLMDDNEIERSYPLSPPLEILTIKVSKKSEIDLDPTEPPSLKEQALFDRWIKDNRESRVARFFTQEREPTRLLNLGTHDDDDEEEDDANFFASGSDDSADDNAPMAEAEMENWKEREMRRRSRKKKASRSVASGSSSLLSMPIEEERVEDLQEHELIQIGRVSSLTPSIVISGRTPLVRVRSAPNLAGFPKLSHGSRSINEDLKMTGIHSYHTAEIFRGTSSSRGSKGRTNGQPGSSASHNNSTSSDLLVVKSEPVQLKKKSIFRQERAIKAGIHQSASYISDPSSSEGSVSFSSRSNKKSRNARKARIRRLQALSTLNVTGSDDTRASPEEGTHSHRMKTQRRLQSSKIQIDAPSLSVAISRVHSADTASSTNEEDSDPPQPEAHTLLNETAARTGQSIKSSGTVSSYDSGISACGGSYMIDLLDVQLAELHREDGEIKGPEEGSL